LADREKFIFEDHSALQLIVGTSSTAKKIIADIERDTGVKIHLRGGEVTLEGESEESRNHVAKLLQELYRMARSGDAIHPQDFGRALEIVRDNSNTGLNDVYGDRLLVGSNNWKGVTPRSLAQKYYIDSMRNHSLTFGVGPAGTGKTYLAVAMAVRRLQDKQIRKIVLTRPAVEAGENLGFLPGTLEEKISPYMRPLYDALFDILGRVRTEKYLEESVIEIAPLAYMRGRTINDAFIILDEAQNTSREQMKMFLTRIGTGSWVVVTGDPSQVDSLEPSGLVHSLHVLRRVRTIAICPFTETDVMRHPLVQEIVRAYDRDRIERHERRNGHRRERNIAIEPANGELLATKSNGKTQ